MPTLILIIVMTASFVVPALAQGPTEKVVAKASQSAPQAPAMRSPTPADLKKLETIDRKYQQAKGIEIAVEKTVKSGLFESVSSSKGTLVVSSGRIRMELEGEEKSLLVINKKKMWAVTFPPADLKTAPVRVIQANLINGKSKTTTLLSGLALGGMFKKFTPTGVQVLESGANMFFLQPKTQSQEFTRAQVVISKDGQQIESLRYWDEKDNETFLAFSKVTFGKKFEDKVFTFTPPEKAEIVEL